MAQAGVILCLAYILALLCTGLLPASSGWQNYWILASGLGVLGLGIAIMVPRFWRTSPKFGVWLVAVVIGFLTPLYFKFQIPQPGVNDVSKFVSTREGNTQEQLVIIKGEIESTPRLTRSGRSQFQLEASQLNEIRGSNKKPANMNQKVTGKLYVTVPLLQATGLHPGQAIAVTGVLYKPKLSDNPGGFNFQRYLAQEGIFAGLKGRQINLPDEVNFRWGWWTIRQWIIRAQVEKLGVPEGPLVSAMVLGNRVVDLPFYLSDSFIRTGLAHALAASGFQVSLILGVVLALTGRFSSKTQFIFGITALLIFLGLTGPQPSVLRAVVMGVGGLVGLVQKKT